MTLNKVELAQAAFDHPSGLGKELGLFIIKSMLVSRQDTKELDDLKSSVSLELLNAAWMDLSPKDRSFVISKHPNLSQSYPN